MSHEIHWQIFPSFFPGVCAGDYSLKICNTREIMLGEEFLKEHWWIETQVLEDKINFAIWEFSEDSFFKKYILLLD